MGHGKRAEEILRKTRAVTTDLDLYYRSSLLLASLTGEGEALSLLRSLIDDFPDRHEAYHNAALLAIDRGDFALAGEIVRKGIRNCSSLDPESLSHMYGVLGTALYRGGDAGAAARTFDRALELDGRNEVARLNLRIIGERMRSGNGL
jgi:tetratricopeptide (TPR) repeat protein